MELLTELDGCNGALDAAFYKGVASVDPSVQTKLISIGIVKHEGSANEDMHKMICECEVYVGSKE